MTDLTGYSVLLKNPDVVDLNKIAAVLASFTEHPMIDARRLAKNAWGILGENLQEDKASQLIKICQEKELPVILLKSHEVAEVSSVQTLRYARCEEDGLIFTMGSSSDEYKIPWASISLLSALSIREEISITKTVDQGPSANQKMVRMGITMLTGIPLGLGKKKEVKKVIRQGELYFYMDLFARTKDIEKKSFIQFQIDMYRFNFGDLREEIRPDVIGNFRLFLKKIYKKLSCPVNHGVKIFESNQPLTLMGYNTSQDYKKECQWLLSLNPMNP